MWISRYLLLLIFFVICYPIKKTYVLDVNFKGNISFEDDELARLLRLKKKSFMSTTEFKSNKLNLDLIKLQSYYKSKGYLDVEIDYLYDYIDKNNVTIDFLISEGERYKIREISISGNKSFEDFYILDNFEYYNPLDVRNQLLEIKNEYLKIGKVNISINEEIIKENGYVDIYIYISEGNKFYIDDINISGLEKIDKKLVWRELVFNSGDLYNANQINTSKSYLFESQLFSSIEMFPYVTSDSTLTLDIRLRELRSREIEFEFGFSQLPSNQGDLPISAINILGNYDRSNLFNSATRLSFKAEYGFSYSDQNEFLRSYYELGLYSPWFVNIRIPFRFKIYNENISFKASPLIGDRKTGIAAYVENYRSSNPYLSSGLITEFFESNSRYQNRSLYVSYIKHNMKNFVNPLNGYYISINPRLNGTILGGTYNYFKNDFEAKSFINFFKKMVFAARIKAGFIYELDDKNSSFENNVPEFDRFFLGGGSSLRGWTSPDDYSDIQGGASRMLLNLEIRAPLYKIIGLEFFYDGGFVDRGFLVDFSDIENFFNWNIGWGFVIQTNLGPARIDFAFKEAVGKGTIQVSLLNMF